MTAKLSPREVERKRQPAFPTGIDWTNPLTRGLQTLFDGARCRDLVSRRPLSPRSPATGRAGLGHAASGSTTVAQLPGQVFTAGSGLTIFVLIDHGAPGSPQYQYLTGRGTNSSGTDCDFGFDSGSALSVYTAGGGSSGALGAPQAAGLHSYAVTSQGTALTGYIDGKVSGSDTYTVSVANSPQPLQIGAGSSDYLTECFPGKYLLVGWWNRALTAGEMRALHANPWQVFAPDLLPLFAPVVTAQYARPTADASAGTWTASSGSDLYAMLDEAAANDTDYIVTLGASTCEVALGTLSDPSSSAGHIVRYRISATSGGITVRLRQGTTTIATWTHASAPSSLTTYEQTLTGGEADSITDYSALRLQFEATT